MARSIATSSTGSTRSTSAPGDGERQLADVAHRDALGDGVAARRHRLAGQELAHGRVAGRFHADHLHLGLAAPRAATAQPAIMPPPPTGTTRMSSSGHVLQHLERDRALAGDDARIVVGMHEDELLRRGQAMRLGGRLRQRVAVQHHARAVTARVLHLHVGREGRHDDGRGDAETPGVIGHALGVVAGATWRSRRASVPRA